MRASWARTGRSRHQESVCVCRGATGPAARSPSCGSPPPFRRSGVQGAALAHGHRVWPRAHCHVLLLPSTRRQRRGGAAGSHSRAARSGVGAKGIPWGCTAAGRAPSAMFRNLWGRDIRVNGRKYRVSGVAGEGAVAARPAASWHCLIFARQADSRAFSPCATRRRGAPTQSRRSGSRRATARSWRRRGRRSQCWCDRGAMRPGVRVPLTRGHAAEAARPCAHCPLRGP